MLNFTAVAYGSSEDTLAFCERIRRLFREKICNGGVYIYDREYIKDIRFEPALVDTCSKFGFTLKPQGFKKEYCGFFTDGYSCTDEIYARLFSSEPDCLGLFVNVLPEVGYDEQSLFCEIERHFKSDDAENGDVRVDCDFEIGFELTRLELDCYYAHARFSIDIDRINGRVDEFVDWFRFVVKFCDVNFSNCFHSAYISNNPKGLEIAHAAVFCDHDKSDLESKLLGCEWYVYICQRIYDSFDRETADKLLKFATIVPNINGVSYTLKMPLMHYRSKDSLPLYDLLGDKLISGVSMQRWDEFTVSKRILTYPIEHVKIYSDMLEDKYLLLVYKCTPKKISSLAKLDYKTHYKSYRHYHY